MTALPRRSAWAPAMERNHWFDYKYIAAQDLVAEQDYIVGRHRLHNRLLHGCGVVCGLKVQNHPSSSCAAGWVAVGEGIAIDAFGRELILAEETAFRLPVEEGEGGSFVICLRYREEGVQPVPILYSDPDEHVPRREANRIREGVEIVSVPAPDFDAAGWEVGRPGCIEPAPTERDGLVALAVADVDPDGEPVEITNRPRRLGGPAELPARIVELSWEHGGTLTIGRLRRERRVLVTFDRPLAPAEGRARGIGPETFCLTRERTDGPSRPVAYDGAPSLADDRHTAVFEIAEEALQRNHEAYLGGSLVRVTLRCDFILDADGVPVSGRHLGGRLPTGEGGIGGTFESWFQVPEAAARQRPRRGERDEVNEEQET